MTGLQLSKEFFFEECLPSIEKKVPEVLPYLAAGLVGEGSECFGYDDEKSRDHDWGASVCLWIPKEAADFADGLLDVFAAFPEEFEGFPVKKTQNGRTGLFGIGGFYRSLIGLPKEPETISEWMSVEEPKLAAAVNGEVFLDNYGEFSRIRRALLAHYPEDVRLIHIAHNAAMAAQTGQYNFPRSINRGDRLTLDMITSHFVFYAANLIFLLNRRYKPFYKWTYRALQELPVLGRASHERLEKIMQEDDMFLREKLIEEQSRDIIEQFGVQGLTNGSSDFMLDHVADIISRIKDEKLRSGPLSMVL